MTLRLVDRAAPRLLPLRTLMGLSLVFPDHAPSRFAIALRSASGKSLERAVAHATATDRFPTPQESAEETVALLGAINSHDRLTRGHCERVRAYADLIGEQLHLDQESRGKLHWAALVHDVGKLDVPREILTKKGRPTDDEWRRLREHPGAAARYLAGLDAWLGDWARAATEHHERVDGEGYPLGLRGDEISLAGRIVAVADAYDVMTSARSYKKPFSPELARAELTANAGTQFDPDVARAFLQVSLRELRLVMGPLALLWQLPTLAQIPFEAATAAVAPAVAVAVTSGLAILGPAHSSAAASTAQARRASGPTAVTPAASRGGTGDSSGDSRHPGGSATTPTTGAGTSHRSTTAGGGRAGTTAPGATTTTTATSRGRGSGGSSSPTTTTPVTAPPQVPPTTTVPDRAPIAVNDSATAPAKAQSLMVDVLANDHDPDGNLDPSTLAIVTHPDKKGYQSLEVVKGQVKVTEPANYTGVATVTYRICDTRDRCAQAIVTVDFSG